MKRYSFIATIAGLGLILAVMWLQGSNPASFLSPSAAVACFGVSFAVMLMLFSPADMRQAFRAVTMRRAAGRQELEVALGFFRTMQRVFLAAGPIGLILGIIQVLEGLGHPNIYVIGEGVAVAIDCLLYSLGGIAFIAVPGMGAARKKLALLEEES